ncbi:hypothetical protein SSTU70S_06409 [Stutzerimonas stutzeri]
MAMVIEAAYADGTGVANALRMSQVQWHELQRNYRVGDLQMPCCSAPAVPKVSANGYPFFAHLGGACTTSEESQWHLAAKILVRSVLEDLGCRASVEMPGSGDAGRWQADVWGERNGVRLAVEIQRSYQSLRDYRKRQGRYSDEGVKSLWLLGQERYSTLAKSMGKERLRTEFGGKFPPGGHFGPCLPDRIRPANPSTPNEQLQAPSCPRKPSCTPCLKRSPIRAPVSPARAGSTARNSRLN